jgi:hypothetical protein
MHFLKLFKMMAATLHLNDFYFGFEYEGPYLQKQTKSTCFSVENQLNRVNLLTFQQVSQFPA